MGYNYGFFCISFGGLERIGITSCFVASLPPSFPLVLGAAARDPPPLTFAAESLQSDSRTNDDLHDAFLVALAALGGTSATVACVRRWSGTRPAMKR